MRFAYLALAVAFLTGCTVATPAGGDPWLAVARAAQAQMEYAQQNDVVYVVSDAIPIQGRQALSRLRKTVRPHEVAAVRGYTLPPGYVVIRSFELFVDSAVISVQGGPVEGNSNVSCGYNIRVPVKRVGDSWLAEYAPIVVC